MTLATTQPLPPRAAYTDELIFRLTVDQYHQLIRSGNLTEDDPVELIEGILVFKMPKKSPHVMSTGLARREVEPLLPRGWHYRSQDPITLSDGEPEPDGMIVRGTLEDYAARHPGPADVALVIEVADTSLERDRGIKLRSYARAGIPCYWLINLIDRQVEVYEQPDPAAQPQPAYRRKAVHPTAADAAILLTLGGVLAGQLRAASLLPPEG
ncbi:MAG: Uma2 family endonuclease [Tepidisphaeraceae bacterium]